MSRRSRPSASKKTKVAIASAALLGLLGGIAIYRSQLAPPAQSAKPPLAHRSGPEGTPSEVPRSHRAEGKAKTTIAPLAGNGADASVTGSSDAVRLHSHVPSTPVELHGPPPRRGRFGITGVPSGPLAPGLSARLDLVLTNPNKFPIIVRSLTVTVRSISAPRADPDHSCGARDFTVAQFSGGGLRLRPSSTSSLGRLGIARSRWPRVGMPDRPINQDGCKGASLRLDYRGVSR